MKRGKKYLKSTKGLDREMTYSIADGVKKAKSLSYSNFTGTLELHVDIKLPKDRDAKSIKGAVSLPNSNTTKTVRIAVFATPDKDEAAKAAGADLVGMEQLMKDVKAGKIEFDVAIATPAVMPKIAVLGKELGPKGLMPNPKSGTVTMDVAKALEEIKAGKVEYRLDKTNIVHTPIGKVSFGPEKLKDNFTALLEAVVKAKPAAAKGQYLKSVTVASTMGPGVKINPAKI